MPRRPWASPERKLREDEVESVAVPERVAEVTDPWAAVLRFERTSLLNADLRSPGETDSSTRAEFRCRACGYGLIRNGPPVVCPMCQAREWEGLPWRPFPR
jgi:rubrerythrin